MPVYAGPYTGVATINPANTAYTSEVSGSSRALDWYSSTQLRYLSWTGTYGRVYKYTTPVAYRVGGLEYTSSTTLTSGGGGSPEFYSMAMYGSGYVAARAGEGGAESFNNYAETYNSSGTAQNKFDLGITFDGGIRLVSGTRLFYQDDNVIYERVLSSAGDVSTAGAATAHTMASSSSTCYAFDFDSTGTRLYMSESGGIREYSCSGYNIGSASHIGLVPDGIATSRIAHTRAGELVTTGGLGVIRLTV